MSFHRNLDAQLFSPKAVAKRKAGPNKPLRTQTEMAEEFGITSEQLRAIMRWSPIPRPAPVMKHHSNYGVGATWYDPDELRAWWRAHKAAKGIV